MLGLQACITMPVLHLFLAYHFKQVLPFFFEDVTFPPGFSIFIGKSTRWQSVLTPAYFLTRKPCEEQQLLLQKVKSPPPRGKKMGERQVPQKLGKLESEVRFSFPEIGTWIIVVFRFFIWMFFLLCVHDKGWGMYAAAPVWRSEDNLVTSVHSFSL